MVLGYGINVGPMAYPPELGDRATSLESELDRPVERAALWVETLAALSRRYEDLLDGRFDAILDAWRERAPASRGARVTWNTVGGPQAGITEGIDHLGALLVRVGDRVERIVAGEVIVGVTHDSHNGSRIDAKFRPMNLNLNPARNRSYAPSH